MPQKLWQNISFEHFCHKNYGKVFVLSALSQNICAMKRENELRKLLGISQIEMAMLLQISRSQWSMFEIGQRDLPLAAKQLLAELLQYLQTTEAQAKAPNPKTQTALQKELEAQLRENEYQRLLIAQRTAFYEKKYHQELRAWQLSEFLKTRKHHKKFKQIPHLITMTQKTVPPPPPENLILWQHHQHKQELLELERLLLESQYRKVNRAIN